MPLLWYEYLGNQSTMNFDDLPPYPDFGIKFSVEERDASPPETYQQDWATPPADYTKTYLVVSVVKWSMRGSPEVVSEEVGKLRVPRFVVGFTPGDGPFVRPRIVRLAVQSYMAPPSDLWYAYPEGVTPKPLCEDDLDWCTYMYYIDNYQLTEGES